MALSDAMNRVLKLSETQSKTAVKVMTNLMSEVQIATQNQKFYQVQQSAKSFGVSIADIGHLKGALTPVLPYEFRRLEMSSDHLENVMDKNKRLRMIASTEVLVDAEEVLKNPAWAGERNCVYKTIGYKSPWGMFSE